MAAPKVEEKQNDKKYEPTLESTQKLNADDLALLEKVNKKYGNKLDPLYPTVIRTFITGYAHMGDQREEETYTRVEHYLSRHDEYNFPGILDEKLDGEEAMMKAWPVYTYGFDHQGHPVLYDEIASSSVEAVTKAFGKKGGGLDPEKGRRYRYRFWRRLCNAKRIQSDQLGGMLMFKHTMIMDMGGFSAAHFGGDMRNIVRDIIGDEQHVFPETLYVCFVINTPWAFRLIWSIVSNFIDPITYKKIKVLGGDFLGEMQKFIDIDQIPPKYGGKGTKPIKLGHSSDLPHDRYPLDYKPKQKGSNDYEAKEQ